MENKSQSIFAQEIHPKHQAMAAFAGVVLIGGLGSMAGFDEKTTEQFPWMIGVAFMLVFAIFNSVLWLSAENMIKYFSDSMTWYVLLAVASGLFAFALTGKNPNDVGSIKWIFIVMTIGYFVFMAIMGSIKRFITFLNKEQEKKLSGKYDQIRRKKRK